MGIEKRLIEDANLTRGMQLATPERITKVIRDVLKGEVGARVKVYEQTCMRCGACAKACHFSLSHPDDASYTPVAKLDKTIFKMVRESGKLNADRCGASRRSRTPNATCAAAASITVPWAWTSPT